MSGLCSHCEFSVWCNSWGEVKCKATKTRVLDHINIIACPDYKRRGKGFKETKCQCKYCLRVADSEVDI